MKNWLTRLLFDWVFRLLYSLLRAFLKLVDFIESFFDVFAGTVKVVYQDEPDYLINVFFGHDAVTNAFWGMALIAIVLAFAAAIIQVSRKAADITGSMQQSVGQIISNFFRSLLIIVCLNAVTVAAVNMSNVLLDRINFALENAAILDQESGDKTFSDEEYATMARALATVANYNVNSSADSRYNANSCFNAIRPELMSLQEGGVFEYEYPKDRNGHYTWQGALQLIANSASLEQDLNLSTYYEEVVSALKTVNRELTSYPDFAPARMAQYEEPSAMDTDVLIFLITSMEAAENPKYNGGDFDDSLRRGYLTGKKDYNDLTQVRKDFDIWEIDYLVGYVSAIVFIIIMAICIFTFIVRLFNILLLYITAPIFASTISLDDGDKWRSWIQAFVIQLFSGFGLVIAMRLYLIIIPIVMSSELTFFTGSGLGNRALNQMARLLMVLGGAWAVLKSGDVITGILSGNPGHAAIEQQSQMTQKMTALATNAPIQAMNATGTLLGGAQKAVKQLSPEARRTRNEARAEQNSDRAQRMKLKSESAANQASRRMSQGKYDSKTARLMSDSAKYQREAESAQYRAQVFSAKAGKAVDPGSEKDWRAEQYARRTAGLSGERPADPQPSASASTGSSASTGGSSFTPPANFARVETYHGADSEGPNWDALYPDAQKAAARREKAQNPPEAEAPNWAQLEGSNSAEAAAKREQRQNRTPPPSAPKRNRPPVEPAIPGGSKDPEP